MPDLPPASAQILQLAASRFLAKPLYVAAHLGVADFLASGPQTVEELARCTGTHAPSLYRVLRCLASVGIFRETDCRAFDLTPAAQMLVSGEGSLRPMVLWMGDPRVDHVWESFLWTVQTGRPAVEKAHGTSAFGWLNKDPDLEEVFNDAMSSNASVRYAAVVDTYDFSGIRRLVDVGGGHGALMTRILKANPALRGAVFDLPSVIEGTTRRLLEWGVADRCEAIGDDMFREVPQADAHIMSSVLHDWDDEHCGVILRNCHQAATPQARLLIVEIVATAANEPSFAKLLDMQMLALSGGRERTEQEYGELLHDAGYHLMRVIPTRGPVSVLEATRI
jgi:O-methyltransferase